MSVDYRLLERFEASRRRFEAARELLPEPWRDDPRDEVQLINERWITVLAQAREQQERLAQEPAPRPVVFLDER